MYLERGNVRQALVNFLCLLYWVKGVYSSYALIDLAEYKNFTEVDKAQPNAPVLTDPTMELMKLEGTRFSILRKRVTWPEAVTECQSRNVRLVSLPIIEDAKSLIQAIQKISKPFFEGYEDEVKKFEFGMDRRYWIGLTDMVVEGEWEWIAEGYALKYSDLWYMAQPDHSRQNTSEHCSLLWNPGYEYGDTHTFNDEDCSSKHYAVCGEQPPFFENLLRRRDPLGKLSAKNPSAHIDPNELPPCSAESDENTFRGNVESVECDESKPTRKPKRKHAHKKIRKGRKTEKNDTIAATKEKQDTKGMEK